MITITAIKQFIMTGAQIKLHKFYKKKTIFSSFHNCFFVNIKKFDLLKQFKTQDAETPVRKNVVDKRGAPNVVYTIIKDDYEVDRYTCSGVWSKSKKT